MQDLMSHDHIRATTVKGTNVYNIEGDHLGSIADIIIGKKTGQADYAILSFGGFLGMGEKYHPLPWQSLTYSEERNGYVVNVSREQLEGAPSYDESAEPDWNDPAYGDRVRTHYGTPLL